jgi:hypothetical protein
MKRKERKQKKEKRFKKEHILSIIIALVMISSVFGVIFYGYSGADRVEKYNGMKFSLTTRGVETKIDGNKYYFHYFPQQVEDINISQNALNAFNSKYLYITYDPNASYVREMAIMQFNLQDFLNQRETYAVAGITQDMDNVKIPTITCANATQFTPVVEIREGDALNITEKNNCIIITGDTGFNLERVEDRIKLGLLGIIK